MYYFQVCSIIHRVSHSWKRKNTNHPSCDFLHILQLSYHHGTKTWWGIRWPDNKIFVQWKLNYQNSRGLTVTFSSTQSWRFDSSVQSTLAILIELLPTNLMANSSHVGANLLQCPHLSHNMTYWKIWKWKKVDGYQLTMGRKI